jgi:hypothetical protein
MAVQTPPQRSQTSYAGYEDERGQGWLTYACVLLLTLGVLNVIDGIAALSNAHFYVGNAHYVFGDLNTWGWVVLCLGVLQVVVALGAWSKNQLARWAGVVVVSLNAIAQLLMMPAYPLWSLSLFAVNILALYALIAYGSRTAER